MLNIVTSMNKAITIIDFYKYTRRWVGREWFIHTFTFLKQKVIFYSELYILPSFKSFPTELLRIYIFFLIGNGRQRNKLEEIQTFENIFKHKNYL